MLLLYKQTLQACLSAFAAYQAMSLISLVINIHNVYPLIVQIYKIKYSFFTKGVKKIYKLYINNDILPIFAYCPPLLTVCLLSDHPRSANVVQP